ncbi:MAG: amidophosphoribosyltransferase [Rikenellaceae bacterium]
MEQLKHECGVAMIRLRKPIDYYTRKYGSPCYALDKMYLLMEKQHNRGQEGAGLSCVKITAKPGEEFIFRERAEGSGAISEIFATMNRQIFEEKDLSHKPFIGELYMGHLRYSTTGRSGISYVHPFLRRNNYRANTLSVCGNFNMTNVDEIFKSLTDGGQHPRRIADTTVLLEQIGHRIDREIDMLYETYHTKDRTKQEITRLIEQNIKLENVLRSCAPVWDGGYVICGQTGSGESFAVRDPNGIRTAFVYQDEEIVVITSERPVIQTALNVPADSIRELAPGEAVIVGENGQARFAQIVEPKLALPCSFERIYFSRGSDKDIYLERKGLGAGVVPDILKSIGNDIPNTVLSFIPNTAEVAFYGMIEEFNIQLDKSKAKQILAVNSAGNVISAEQLNEVLSQKVRLEKVVIKDIKLRTFITEGASRKDLASHVYDITYGTVKEGVDNLVVIDDSIVRGTTLRESIIKILSRLNPRKLVVVSSSPQIRYPDFYGIDMSNIGDLIAFRAAEALAPEGFIDSIYAKCVAQKDLEASQMKNYVDELYSLFTPEQISAKIVELVTPEGITCPLDIIFQSVESLHNICPNHPGDWYFTGNYPTSGGVKQLNNAFMAYYEKAKM